MSSTRRPGRSRYRPVPPRRAPETATCTVDVVASLDGHGSWDAPGDRGGYWVEQGPELLAHRLAVYVRDQRMVLGASTFRAASRVLDGRTVELTYRPALH